MPDCLSEHLAYTPDVLDPEALSVLQPERDPAGEGSRRLNRRRLRRHRPVVLHRDRPAPSSWRTCLVYRDDNHITATYANWLTPAIGAQLEVATDGVF